MKLRFINALVLLGFLSCLAACKSPKSVISGNTDHLNPDLPAGITPDKKQDSRNNTPVFIDANRQKILGNYEEAIRLFKQCLSMDNADAASMFELAKIYLYQDQPADALEYAKKAAATDPGNIWYQLLLVNVYQKNYEYDEAVKILEKLAKKYPDQLDYADQLALAFIYAGKYDDAIRIYNDIESKTGITEDLSLKKQQLYLQQKKLNQAIEEMLRLIDKYPDQTRFLSILARIYEDNDMPEKAFETYHKILTLDPGDPYIHITLADYYRKLGDDDKSFEELKLGFLNPSLDIDMKIQILLTYYAVGEVYSDIRSKGFELSDILLKTHPDDPKSYSIHADFLIQDKKFSEARDALHRVISLDSSRYLVWEQLLFAQSQLEDNEALLTESEKTIELFPEQPVPYLYRGAAFYQKKQWTECIAVLEKGMGMLADNKELSVQFYTYLGDAFNQVKDYARSDDYYEKALELNPDNDYVLNNYAYYLSLRNEHLEKAAQMARRATELKQNNSSNQDTYGWVLYQLGSYAEALEWIGKALTNGGDTNPVILEHYGDVLYKLERKEEALEYWLKAQGAGKGSDLLEKKISTRTLYE
jgi:tetratricopeptide (TPR) repeat protein